MKTILAATLLITTLACSHQKEEKKEHKLPQTLEEAVSSDYRSPENKKRDQYRHPLETLKFFGLKKDMTVVEIWPSSGWYSEILAPYLAGSGKYIAADPENDPKGYTFPRKSWLLAHPEVAGTVYQAVFNPNGYSKLAADGSVDMVLTFRNVHNWLPRENQLAAFKTFYKALKPGGILGVVDHRANPSIAFDPKSGYVLEKDVIALAQKAGFKLQEKSEINANPKDKTDYPDGVWTLPPRLRLGDKDKEKYQAIGESDRLTLKFVKPKR